MRKLVLSVVSLLVVVSFLTACAAPTPQVVEKVVTQQVEKVVTQVVEKTVVQTVQVEKVVVATPAPTAVPAKPAVDANTLPRNETLYFNGQQWGAVVGWNPYSNSNNNAMAIAQQDNARVIMFETPYLYNMLDGKQYPLLADGDYAWNDARDRGHLQDQGCRKVERWHPGDR